MSGTFNALQTRKGQPDRRRRLLGPIWPAIGPDRGENVSCFRRDALSAEYQEAWDIAQGASLRGALGIDRIESDINTLRESIADLELEDRPRNTAKGPSRRATGGMDLPPEVR